MTDICNLQERYHASLLGCKDASCLYTAVKSFVVDLTAVARCKLGGSHLVTVDHRQTGARHFHGALTVERPANSSDLRAQVTLRSGTKES